MTKSLYCICILINGRLSKQEKGDPGITSRIFYVYIYAMIDHRDNCKLEAKTKVRK